MKRNTYTHTHHTHTYTHTHTHTQRTHTHNKHTFSSLNIPSIDAPAAEIPSTLGAAASTDAMGDPGDDRDPIAPPPPLAAALALGTCSDADSSPRALPLSLSESLPSGGCSPSCLRGSGLISLPEPLPIDACDESMLGATSWPKTSATFGWPWGVFCVW